MLYSLLFICSIRFRASNVPPHGSYGSTYAPSNEHETSWSNPLPLPGSSAHGCPCCTRLPSWRLAARVKSNCGHSFLYIKPGQVLKSDTVSGPDGRDALHRKQFVFFSYRITFGLLCHLQCGERTEKEHLCPDRRLPGSYKINLSGAVKKYRTASEQWKLTWWKTQEYTFQCDWGPYGFYRLLWLEPLYI